MSVVDKIQHYQRSIEKCPNNEERVMHCISKLYRLPVTVQHLQETGVGRTIYALRKYDGDVGEAAKALVAKWKNLVADELSSDGEDDDEAGAPDPPEDCGYSSDSQKPEKNVDDNRRESRNRDTEESAKDSLNKSESSKHSSKSMSRENSKTKSNDKPRSSNEHDKHKYSKNESEKRELKSDSKLDKNKLDSKHESKSEKKSKSDGDSKSNRHNARKEEKHKLNDKERSKFDSPRKDVEKVSSSSGLNKTDADSEQNHRKRKLDSSTVVEKRRKNSESENEEDNQPVSDSEEGSEKVLPSTLDESEYEEGKVPKIEIKQEPLSPSSKHKQNDLQRSDNRSERKSSKEKSKDSSNKSKSSSVDNKSRRDEEKDKKKEDESKDHRKSEKRKSESRHSSGESSKSKSHTSSSSSKNKNINKDKEKDKHENRKESSSAEFKTGKTTFKEPKEKKKIKQEINGDEGIDCNSGASFAEALGMCTKPLSSRKRNSSSPNLLPIKAIKTEPGISSSPNSKTSIKVKTEPPSSDDSHPLSLLSANVKLEPLNVDLASTLPEISPNYKPLPYISPVYRKHEEDKTLSQVMYAKNQRTKVYSGNKCGNTNVPSLYEMCIRILIENIEALEFTGGVPYFILKPVLERATADQLFMLEHHNPYLIDDTDVLWQFHCNREFRSKQREEMETWREMYMRCLDEREAKLKALTANIKQSIDKSVPVRVTKLAYVNNVVKPPRNVLRKQAKYGTASATPNSVSDLKRKLISGDGSTTTTNISVPPPPPNSRIKTSPAGIVKKTKAPLMAKALQLIKGRYKR